MSTPIAIIATLEALRDKEASLKKVLPDVISPTLAEPGCINYFLHQSLEDPTTFLGLTKTYLGQA